MLPCRMNKLFVPEKGYKVNMVKRISSPRSPQVPQAQIPGGRLRVQLEHIDVNTREDQTGYTPLIIAVLNGFRDIAETLLFYSADVNAQDSKGNTAMHMAVFSGRADIIELLIKHKAKVNTLNSDGNTPLHIACQCETENRVLVLLKLLREDALIEAKNKNGATPLDVAAMYNKKGQTLNFLLCIFSRIDAAKTLLEYGANSKLQNPKNETPESLAENLPNVISEKFLQLFEDYPELPSLQSWTQNTPDYCNSCTANHPNTNILDGNLQTFWIIQEAHHSWTILDLQTSHTLTGITVYGWKSKQMIKSFELQKGDSINGPWSTVGSFKCEMKGSEDPKAKGVAQVFKNFTASGQYWRLFILENHGGNCTCFQGITLHGADDRIFTFFDKLDLLEYADKFVMQEYNSYKKFLFLKEDIIRAVLSDDSKSNKVKRELEKICKIEFPLTFIKWLQPPPLQATEGDVLPQLKVKADPGCTAELEVFVEEHKIQGVRRVHLVAGGENDPSTATFSDLVIDKCGVYRLCVRGVENEDIVLESQANTEIKPKSKLSHEMEEAFNDMEAMLASLQSSMEPT
ncbi:hypothetical protein KUTeg_020939 [Tegillarca granosa]|uniref:F5/8 type C domain-containing protein n=1 Tax=Tegillarca granosa TaxID=220873 RepID=A0ABQ9EDI2_TEGGR|nr:hypothetical protein KUTeg_020939 [Tegillarca granosa]